MYTFQWKKHFFIDKLFKNVTTYGGAVSNKNTLANGSEIEERIDASSNTDDITLLFRNTDPNKVTPPPFMDPNESNEFQIDAHKLKGM